MTVIIISMNNPIIVTVTMIPIIIFALLLSLSSDSISVVLSIKTIAVEFYIQP